MASQILAMSLFFISMIDMGYTKLVVWKQIQSEKSLYTALEFPLLW